MKTPEDPHRDYAYRVPLNPYEPTAGEWGTLVRRERVSVGERLDVAVAERVEDETVVHGSLDTWEVVAIEVNGDEGHTAPVRGKGAPVAVWDGTLVLRQVRVQS